MKTYITLLLSWAPLATFSQKNIPTHTCKTLSGRFLHPDAGKWSEDFFYGSPLVDFRSANTDYNRFRAEYRKIRIAYRAKKVSAYAFQATCVHAANSSYVWCNIPCTVDFEREKCRRQCRADLLSDWDACYKTKENRIETAQAAADHLLRLSIIKYGGCY